VAEENVEGMDIPQGRNAGTLAQQRRRRQGAEQGPRPDRPAAYTGAMIRAVAVRSAGAAHEITTERLLLKSSRGVSAAAVADFYHRNAGHFARWDPPAPPGFFTPRLQADRLKQANDAFAAGVGYRYWLTAPSDTKAVIGSVHFSNVVRGAFHSCTLGYAIDAAFEGRGLMCEALAAGIAEMFCQRVRLHRVQAGVRPENTRSLALMQRLAFEAIGLARHYLMIDGDWRDHQLFQRIHPDWQAAPG
jgi:[ribosomal protein S5]-alanine N-acetyltransferase